MPANVTSIKTSSGSSISSQGAYTSFSGADIVASITVPGDTHATVVGELQTITYSIHREKAPVRALGFTNPKGFTNGMRTIGGSLIFTVFDRHIMHEFRDATMRHSGNFITDEMPPFNVTVTFANEYGATASLAIFGITIVSEGQTMSIDDIITENVMSYMARDISLMEAGHYGSYTSRK